MEELKNENVNSENEENTSSTEIVKDERNYKEMSPMRLIVRRFFRSKLSIVGVVMIVFLFLFSFLGPVVYRSWGETEIDRTPYTEVIEFENEFVDPEGNTIDVTQEIEVTNPINKYQSPNSKHFLGTDEGGRDVFVRLMYGGRISLTIGFIVVILETIIGIILGGIAGYFGKWIDQIIMRLVDIFNCIPTLPILLISSALLDSWSFEAYQQHHERFMEGLEAADRLFYIPDNMRIYCLMIIITLFGWASTARLVRGQILSLREQEYITATEVMGLPTWRKIFKHLIPNVMPQLIVTMTLGLGSVILYESTLSYLGLGVQLPYAAWGTMISSVSRFPEVLEFYPFIWLPAGVLIVIAVLGFNFVGDGLRDAMDPRSKK